MDEGTAHPDITARLEAFLSGLDALPPSPGLSWRGRLGTTPHQGTFVTDNVLDTTRDLRVATDNFALPAAYAVFGLTGRDLAPFSASREAEELVFLPARVFTVGETIEADGVQVTVVVERLIRDGEVESPEALDERIGQLAAQVGHARALPPVRVDQPERFRGPLPGQS